MNINRTKLQAKVKAAVKSISGFVRFAPTALCLSTLAIHLAFVLALSSCDSVVDVPPTENEKLVLVNDGASSYTVVRSDESSGSITEASITLRDAINAACGTDIKLKTDFVRTHGGEDGPVITVGVTTDPVSASLADGVLADEYIITRNGNNVYIIGGSDDACVAAVGYFIEHKLADSVPTLVFTSGDECRYTVKYKFSSVTLGGRDISDFTVVYPASSQSLYASALVVRDAITKKYGHILPVTTDNMSDSECEIVIGGCDRDGVTAACGALTDKVGGWSVTASGTRLFLAGGKGGIRTSDASVEALLNWLNKAQDGALDMSDVSLSGSVALSAASNRAADVTLRVMTANLLWSDDSAIATTRRAELWADIFSFYLPDVICFNEMYGNIGSSLPGLIDDEYEILTQEYEDIFNGDFTGYTNSLELLQSHTCATRIAVRRDSAVTVVAAAFRYTSEKWWIHSVSWAVLKLPDGRLVGVCSNHHGAQTTGNYANDTLACIASVKAKYGDIPFVITGDLYAWSGDTPITTLTGAGYGDTYYTAATRVRSGLGSYHAVGSMTTGTQTPIDHILADVRFKAVKHHLVADKYSAWASDHFPVYADLILK